MSALPSFLTGNTGNIQGLDELIRRQERLQDEAREANESRYQNTLAELSRQGIQSKADVRRGVAEEKGGITQGLIDRGLGSSTVLDSLMNRSEERGQREATRIDESVADRRAGVMERRFDEYPNLDFIGQLIQQMMQGRGQQQRTHTTVGGAPGGGGSGKAHGGSSSDESGSAGSGGGDSGVGHHENQGSPFHIATAGAVRSWVPPGPDWQLVGKDSDGAGLWKKKG